jgi:hypothetical protein
MNTNEKEKKEDVTTYRILLTVKLSGVINISATVIASSPL